MRDAVEFLRMASIREDTEIGPDKGINVVLLEPAGDLRISLKGDQIDLRSALESVAKQAGLVFRVDEYAVWLGPASADTGILTRRFVVPSDFMMLHSKYPTDRPAKEIIESMGIPMPLHGDAAYDKETKVLTLRAHAVSVDLVANILRVGRFKRGESPWEKLVGNPEQQLGRWGIDFPKGSKASFDPATRRLTVTNTLQELRRVEDELLEEFCLSKVDAEENPYDKVCAYLEKRVPRLSFSETSIREGIAFIGHRRLFVEEEVESVFPIEFDLNRAGTPSLDVEELPRVTLQLVFVPRREALEYATSAAGLKFIVERERILIVHPSVPEPMVTKVFVLPPEAEDRANLETRAKLQTMFVPVNFENVSFREALEFLKTASLQADPEEGADKGFGIVFGPIAAPGGVPGEAPEPSERLITLQAGRLSLADAFRLLAEVAGLEFKLEGGKVCLFPIEEKGK